eukprot:TRINITY_DN8484_c0_g1_i1.p1 TRINITY_DN8484_c0_g1~~TRINITY_DN8484_c0_g1_i1.p1  ORF type:complete len:615 (-),score=113.83 TRINITY_DN8484_c0_g1_i1:656-2500(-)
MSGTETYFSASSRKNRRLHYPSPPALLLDVPHAESLPTMTQISESKDEVIASKDTNFAGNKGGPPQGQGSTDAWALSSGSGEKISTYGREPLKLSPGTPQVQEVVACSDKGRRVSSEKAGVDSGGLITGVGDAHLSPVSLGGKGGRSAKGDSGSETPEWELLNLSPESRPHSPRSGGVRSMKSSASNSSLWSWADVEDGRILEPGGLDAALVDSSHFYFLQADLASAVGTANMPDASSTFHSPARSWSLSPPPSLSPRASPGISENPPASLFETKASPLPNVVASPSCLEDIVHASSVPGKSPESVPEGISESLKLLDEETVLQALVGVGLGAPCPRMDDCMGDKGLRSLVDLSGQTTSFGVGTSVVGGPSCPLFPEYRHHSAGGMDEHHHDQVQQSWPIPVSMGVTSMSMGFGSPITEVSFPVPSEGGRRLKKSGRPENSSTRLDGDGSAVERNSGGVPIPKRGGGQESWPDGVPGDWEEEEVSMDRGGAGMRKEGLAGAVEDSAGGLERVGTRVVRPTTSQAQGGTHSSGQAALEIQKSVLWSLALAGAVLGVMMVGGWHRDRSQNRELRLQIRAKDERIGQLMVQVSQLKEALASRRRVLVLRPVSRPFSH